MRATNAVTITIAIYFVNSVYKALFMSLHDFISVSRHQCCSCIKLIDAVAIELLSIFVLSNYTYSIDTPWCLGKVQINFPSRLGSIYENEM